MNLWITRDMIGAVTMIWYGDCPPTIDNGLWHGDGKAFIMAGRDIPPGTCTELYTEQQVRERVAKAIVGAGPDGTFFLFAEEYLARPSDANWSRLMAEVGAGGGA